MTPIWIVVILICFTVWESLDRTPGPEINPSVAGLELIGRSSNKPTLTLFLHPQCPCARATLNLFMKCLEVPQSAYEIWIVFVRPPGAEADWEAGVLWDRANQIPGGHVVTDIDGVIAKRVGVRTSGHLIVQQKDGELQFSGGITRGRGIEEEGAGYRLVRSILLGQQLFGEKSPVFGCPLFSAEDDITGGD